MCLFESIGVASIIFKYILRVNVHICSYIYSKTMGFPWGKAKVTVEMSVIHVRETDVIWALNLHTAPSTEVPACVVFSCS